MIAALDATALILLLDREAAGPNDPATGKRVEAAQERIAYLAARVGRERGSRIVIPTPAFAEAMVKVQEGAAPQYLALLERVRGMRVVDFTKVAALEFARMQRELISELPAKRRRAETGTRSKAKFDQQIVAIALVERAGFIVTDDDGLGRYAERFGLKAMGVAELELPPSEAQGRLALEPPPEAPSADLDADDMDTAGSSPTHLTGHDSTSFGKE